MSGQDLMATENFVDFQDVWLAYNEELLAEQHFAVEDINLQVKQGELQRKIAKDKADEQFRQQELALKEQEQQSKKVQAGVQVATDFIDKQQQHHEIKRQTITQGALSLAQLAQQAKEHKADTALDLYKHHTQTQQGGTEE